MEYNKFIDDNTLNQIMAVHRSTDPNLREKYNKFFDKIKDFPADTLYKSLEKYCINELRNNKDDDIRNYFNYLVTEYRKLFENNYIAFFQEPDIVVQYRNYLKEYIYKNHFADVVFIKEDIKKMDNKAQRTMDILDENNYYSTGFDPHQFLRMDEETAKKELNFYRIENNNEVYKRTKEVADILKKLRTKISTGIFPNDLCFLFANTHNISQMANLLTELKLFTNEKK